MNYFDGIRWQRDVPLPTVRENALLIKAECSLPLANISESVNIVFPATRRTDLLRKVARYVQAEGLRETLVKIRSRRLEARISSRVFLVSYVGRTTPDPRSGSRSRRVWCLGTRHPAFSEYVLIAPALCFEIPEKIEACDASAIPLLLPFSLENRTSLDFPADLDKTSYSAVAGYSLDSGEPPKLPDFLSPARVEEAVAWFQERRGVVPDRIAAQVLRSPIPPALADSPRRMLRAGCDRGPGAVIVGGGNYARAHAARFVRRCGVRLKWLVEIEPALARSVGEAYGFEKVTTDLRDAAPDPDAGIAVVAGYHSTHAHDAILLLESGKKVLIEKPPATSIQQLDRLVSVLAARPGSWAVGYNRRYAAGIELLRQELRERGHPVTVTCVLHEIGLPPGHWYFWPNQGGRVFGNLCHWIDLGTLLAGEASPVEIFATSNASSAGDGLATRYDDDVSVTVRYADGSLLNIVSSSRGDETLGMHEWIQVRSGGLLATIDDFRAVTISRNGRTLFARRGLRSRGHSRMYSRIIAGFLRDEEPQFSLRQFVVPSRLMIEIEQMLAGGVRRRLVGDLETAKMPALSSPRAS
jgi:predicted dehydrogenase